MLYDGLSMEKISSRKNAYIMRLRALANDAELRRSEREYLCDGLKLLDEAVQKGAKILSVLWKEEAKAVPGLEGARQYIATAELFDYASPMKNSPGPVFTLAMPENEMPDFERAILLENVQDPGNVGTVIRTAAAMGIKTVILCGACADVYSPKTARATMGAVFSENIIRLSADKAAALIRGKGLKLYGAALSDRAKDIRALALDNAVVAIGSEGRGLSAELLGLCDGELIIPMAPGNESLNAAVAASIVLWEMAR